MNMSFMWQSMYCLYTCVGVTLALVVLKQLEFDEHTDYIDIRCMVGNGMTHPRDSLVSCAALCVFTSNCKGVFYINMTLECRLQLTISTPGHACKQENGSRYHFSTTMIPIEPYKFTSTDVARLDSDENVDDICRSYPYKSLNDGVKDDQINCSYMPCCLSQGCFSGDVNDYMGTWSMTVRGYLCQRWDRHHPHTHYWDTDDEFPDATMTDAQNYCREPDEEDRLWCYTTDVNLRWDWCDVPKC